MWGCKESWHVSLKSFVVFGAMLPVLNVLRSLGLIQLVLLSSQLFLKPSPYVQVNLLQTESDSRITAHLQWPCFQGDNLDFDIEGQFPGLPKASFWLWAGQRYFCCTWNKILHKAAVLQSWMILTAWVVSSTVMCLCRWSGVASL